MTVDSARKGFAIVCDSACDLPLSNLERAGVALVPLVVRVAGHSYRDCIDLNPIDFFVQLSSTKGQVTTFTPAVEEFEGVYRSLVDRGYTDIVSLHASSHIRDAYDLAVKAAHRVREANVHVVDTKCVSGQMALVLARLVLDRDAGMSTEAAVESAVRVAEAARALIIPAPDASPTLVGTRHRRGLLGRADSLRVRALGVRRCFSIGDDGVAVEQFRSTDIRLLAGNMARSMSSYSQVVGPLTYVEINAGVPRLLSTIEKPLDTNEFEATRAAILNTNPTTTALLGVGAVGLAYVPHSLLPAEGAARILRYIP